MPLKPTWMTWWPSSSAGADWILSLKSCSVTRLILGGVSQNLSSVTNDSFCYKLLKSLLLIGYQQICHWSLSYVIEIRFCETGPCLQDDSRTPFVQQQGLWMIHCTFLFRKSVPCCVHCTVKPALMTTCLQRPSVYKGHICCFPWKWFLIGSCTEGTCLQRPPFYEGHFLCFPWAVAIDRFDCSSTKGGLTRNRLPLVHIEWIENRLRPDSST